MYEVPSGGDWSVHRGGSIYVENSENVTLSLMTFDQVGGNAVLFSNHVAWSTVADCEFIYPGDSAIVLLGSTEGLDGSSPTYPNHNFILRNHMHETGVYGKQTSCFAQQLSANTTVLDNVRTLRPPPPLSLNVSSHALTHTHTRNTQPADWGKGVLQWPQGWYQL